MSLLRVIINNYNQIKYVIVRIVNKIIEICHIKIFSQYRNSISIEAINNQFTFSSNLIQIDSSVQSGIRNENKI